MVKSLSVNEGNMGSILGLGTRIPHAAGQLRLRATIEPACPRACAPQEKPPQ